LGDVNAYGCRSGEHELHSGGGAVAQAGLQERTTNWNKSKAHRGLPDAGTFKRGADFPRRQSFDLIQRVDLFVTGDVGQIERPGFRRATRNAMAGQYEMVLCCGDISSTSGVTCI